MAQNVTVQGASYSSVPAVILPKTGGGSATFTDVTDTTATASDVASGKYFYTAAGVKTQGTSTSGGYITQDANGYVVLSSTNGVPTLITKSITANGTYNASSDNADGYSSVTVNVPASGGNTNIEVVSVGATYSGVSTYLNHEPKAFALSFISSMTLSQSDYYEYIIGVVFDGTNTTATIYQRYNGRVYHSTTSASMSYDGTDGYLGINALNSTRFISGQGTYELMYVY